MYSLQQQQQQKNKRSNWSHELVMRGGDGCWLEASVRAWEGRSVHARSQAEGDRAPSTIFPPAVKLTPARLSGVIWPQAMRAPRLPRWLLCKLDVKEGGGGGGGRGAREWMLREIKKKTLWVCLVSTGQIPALPSSKLTRWSQDDNDSDSLSVRRSVGRWGGRSRRCCRNSDEPRPRASWRFQTPV